jgi:hypothetical protein
MKLLGTNALTGDAAKAQKISERAACSVVFGLQLVSIC